MKRLKKLRFILVYPLAIGLFLAARTTERSLLIGIVVVALGEALRLWANSYVGHVKVNRTEPWRGDAKIGQLITAGPYAYVRHPLYLGTFLLGVGFCIIVGNRWLALLALLFFLVVYQRKMREEDAVILNEWGETFVRYQHAVLAWIPTWRRYADPQGKRSWEGILASKELKTLAWVIVGVILLYFREEFVQERESLWRQHRLKHIVLLGVAVALALGDGIYTLVHRQHRAGR